MNSSIAFLINQIDNFNIPDTFSIKRAIETADYNVTYYEGRAKLQKTVPPGAIDSNKQAVEYFAHQLGVLKDSLGQARNDFRQKKTLSVRLDSSQRALSGVEFQINQLMIPRISQQNFLFYASLAFVLLMGILLITFYKVVFKDQKVRLAVFGSDSGLQFVTLFSIIIAIILSGLTGILEGKELSALLGSIAGYILGKAKLSSEGNHNTAADTPHGNTTASGG